MPDSDKDDIQVPKVPVLIQRTLAGDEYAYQRLVEKYQQKVYSIAYGVVHNHQDALDVAQDVFIKVYNKLDKFKGQSAFYTWLYRITVNLAIDYHRKKYKVASVEFDEKILDDDKRADFRQSNTQYNPRKLVEDAELHEYILDSINALPPDQKAAISLRELEGLSYDEIAGVMQCSKGTVMSRLHYGRKKLQEMLKKYLGNNR